MSKTILVTGANRGIGFEVCRQLKDLGHRVILTSRDESKGLESANRIGVDYLSLDVSSPESISSLAVQLSKDFGHLDALVNNAGILLDESRSLLKSSVDDIEKTIQTNATGPLLLTLSLQSYFEMAAQVVMVSSGAGEFCSGVSGYAPIYSSSKTLMNAFTRHLAKDFASDHIYINSVCPGWVRTDMGGRNASRSVERGAETIVWLATGGAGQATGKFWRDKKEISW